MRNRTDWRSTNAGAFVANLVTRIFQNDDFEKSEVEFPRGPAENFHMPTKKILLVHGWGYRSYTSSGCTNAWNNRLAFVEALSKDFTVLTPNLPGFGGTPDPIKPWILDDFVQYIEQGIDKEKPDYILGYSFGGAIVLRWKKMTGNKSIKAFLVSPAILRNYRYFDTSTFAKIFKKFLPDKLVSVLRDFYIIHIIKNPYYSHATKIMRETYRNIVAVDLREDLLNVPDSLTLVYGENDSATPLNLVKDILDHSITHHTLHIILSGGHDIAETHIDELINIITEKIQ